MNPAGIAACIGGIVLIAAAVLYVKYADQARAKRLQTGVEWASELGVLAINEQRFLDAGVDFFQTPISYSRFCELAGVPIA